MSNDNQLPWFKVYPALLNDTDFLAMPEGMQLCYLKLLIHSALNEPRGFFSARNKRNLAGIVASGNVALLSRTLDYCMNEWVNEAGEAHIIVTDAAKSVYFFRTWYHRQRMPSEEPEYKRNWIAASRKAKREEQETGGSKPNLEIVPRETGRECRGDVDINKASTSVQHSSDIYKEERGKNTTTTVVVSPPSLNGSGGHSSDPPSAPLVDDPIAPSEAITSDLLPTGSVAALDIAISGNTYPSGLPVSREVLEVVMETMLAPDLYRPNRTYDTSPEAFLRVITRWPDDDPLLAAQGFAANYRRRRKKYSDVMRCLDTALSFSHDRRVERGGSPYRPQPMQTSTVPEWDTIAHHLLTVMGGGRPRIAGTIPKIEPIALQDDVLTLRVPRADDEPYMARFIRPQVELAARNCGLYDLQFRYVT